MSIEGKNPTEENRTEQNQVEPNKKFKNKLVNFQKNNKVAIVLGVLLLIMFIWFLVQMQINEKQFENEKTQIITKYELERDSLQIKHLELVSKVFSWSVRSELLRNNTENLNQLLTVFVKESKVDLVQLINPKNKMVLLSSDKKFEGSPYLGNFDFELTTTIVIKEESLIRIITPVMGFNSRIGILIIELEKD